MTDKIELPPNISSAVVKIVFGAVMLLLALAMATNDNLSWAAALPFLALGVPYFAGGVRVVVQRPPRLRADKAGVWFGGGKVVPWTAIDLVFANQVNVSYSGLQAKTMAISFSFHSKLTLLSLPPTSWLATILSTGNFDVAPGSGNHQVIAARLEAMRAAAIGHEDGVVVGSAPVPPARVVKK